MTLHSCMKRPTNVCNDNQQRVLGSAEITQCLMLSKDQLQERLRRELSHERGGQAADASLQLLTKPTVVTGLELLSLHGNSSTCSPEQSEDDSFESFCANSTTLVHHQQDAGAAPNDNKIQARRVMLIHKIVEEQALEGVVADHHQHEENDSSSFDDFEDFCNDSFHRVDFNKGTAANENTTAIPNLETYAIAGGMGRAA